MTPEGYGIVMSVNVSEKTGVRKTPAGSGHLLPDHGLEGDAHAGGDPARQVSLLARESIEKMVEAGVDVGPGDFAENITTDGLDLLALPLGTRLRLSSGALLEISQIGKVCHDRCAIYEEAGDCVMPREGVFASVVDEGDVAVGDRIEIAGKE